jgi:hypothetical protein
MRQTTNDINKLRESDLITIILYCLYKFTEDPEYTTLSELAYTLDKDSMYKLCATFGGTTLKIPTLVEYKKMARAMLVFDYVNSDGLTFSEACNKAGVEDVDIDDTIKMYTIMNEVLDSYVE